MRKKSALAWACAGLLVLACLVAFWVLRTCANPDTSRVKPIRIGYVPYSSSLPALVAAEQGIFKSHNVAVELVRLETSNECMVAISNGDVDGVMGIGLPALLAVELKTPGQFMMVWYAVETRTQSVNAILVPQNSAIADISGLRGKAVGTFTGATQVLNLQAIITKALGDVNAVTISQVSPNLQLQALEKGEIAALFTIEPHVTLAVERGIGRVLVDNPRCKYILDPFPGGGGVLTTRFIQGRSSEADRLIAAFDEAIQRIRADESAAKAILPKYVPIDAAMAPKSRLYGWWASDQVDSKRMQEVSDLLEREGVIRGHVDVRRLIMGNR